MTRHLLALPSRPFTFAMVQAAAKKLRSMEFMPVYM